ncbi:hypothetical protein NDU88_003665 [Pleurodeles waltl]|uniref:Uncharacterized protein n=1 Tax=Pleurodeles waltl TaxID=8319 RepID=A0AAV7W2T9_PLEWA|nr:hypothetical protein NDU88_003665 [Pleurodeles waltl]
MSGSARFPLPGASPFFIAGCAYIDAGCYVAGPLHNTAALSCAFSLHFSYIFPGSRILDEHSGCEESWLYYLHFKLCTRYVLYMPLPHLARISVCIVFGGFQDNYVAG